MTGDLLTLYVVVAIPLFVSFQHIENMHAVSGTPFFNPDLEKCLGGARRSRISTAIAVLN